MMLPPSPAQIIIGAMHRETGMGSLSSADRIIAELRRAGWHMISDCQVEELPLTRAEFGDDVHPWHADGVEQRRRVLLDDQILQVDNRINSELLERDDGHLREWVARRTGHELADEICKHLGVFEPAKPWS